MTRPTHHAHVVSTPKKEGDKATWTRIGSVFPHQNGTGFDIVIRDGISVSGRIVCTEPKEDPQFESQGQEQINEMSRQSRKP